MIVIVIIAILAALAIPAYEDYLTRAKVSEAFTVGSKLEPIIAEYAQNGKAFNNFTASYVSTSESSGYVNNIGVDSNLGVITVTIGGTSNTNVDTKSIALVPYVYAAGTPALLASGTAETRPINWKCEVLGTAPIAGETNNATLPAKYAPSECK